MGNLVAFVQRLFHPVPEIPVWEFYLRILAIAGMTVMAWCLAEQDNPFFYQAF